jgi:hypothetical protein
MRPDLMTYSPRMVGVKLAILGLVVAVGCTKTNAAAFCADGTCSDPNFAYCDVDGAVSGEPGMCIAVTCAPGEVKQTCNAGGNGYEDVACDLGCAETPTPHCKYLQPKYMPDICDAPASKPSLTLSGAGAIDPNLDTSCDEVVAQSGGTEICVIRAGTLTVAEDAALKILGTSDMTGRAIAFVADDKLLVAGTLDATGHTGVNGPAGGTYSSGGAGSISGTIAAGGGAGGMTSGGAGGSQTNMSGGTDGGGVNGGAPVMNPALLASFIGGGSSGSVPNIAMGGGGGAIMVASCHGEVRVTGIVNAGGGGGAAGIALFLPGFAQGGGAGGNIVIQGVSVSITGQVYANGGGGGGGWRTGGGEGVPGADGSLSESAGASGGNVDGGSGRGGSGGYKNMPPTNGTHPTVNNSGAGAGGGSVGFLQTYTPSGVTATLTPAHVSPAFQPNGVVELR